MKEVKQQQFEKAIEQLNQEQRKAVEHIEGPVMVVAGPGTGKTQILATRIGTILKETDTQPENILCLTYTDAGTIAMRNRLVSFMGPDAYRIEIHTFHSFCNMVIRENPELFSKRDIEPLSELERIEILHEIIDELHDDDALKRWSGDIYSETRRLGNLYDVMKKENITTEDLYQRIDAYIQYMHESDEFRYKKNSKTNKKGDLKIADIDKKMDQLHKLKSAATTFETYQKKLQQAGRYEFEDMIQWVISAFQNHEHLLLNYQERFMYILVDEYQDTNGSQNRILQQLISYWDSPNVFVVGDDDQSIYSFQGANLKNILDFTQQFSDVCKVVLTQNYRSTQFILDSASALIQHNKERLAYVDPDINKNLIAAKTTLPEIPMRPQLLEFEFDSDEQTYICNYIENVYRNNEDISKIAILYNKHKQAEEIIRYLKVKKIPYQVKKQYDVLQCRLIQQIEIILQYIDKEYTEPWSAENLLYEILHFPFFGLRTIDISKLAFQMMQFQRTQNRNISWREYMVLQHKNTTPDLFSQQVLPEDQSNIKNVFLILEECILNRVNYTVQSIIEYILNRCGILEYIMNHAERNSMLQELNTFFDFVKNETAKFPQYTISQLLESMYLMKSNKISIPVIQILGNTKGIQFITLHSSKGLEFDTVFIIGCNESAWNSKNGSSHFVIPTVTQNKSDEINKLEEQRRLFYVGMTRAENQLYICYSKRSKDGKAVKKLQFIEELRVSEWVDHIEMKVDIDDIAQFSITTLTAGVGHLQPILDTQLARKALEKYELSVTHLNTYLKCPISFYFKYVMRLPAFKNSAMEFGTAVHETLYGFYDAMIKTNAFGSIDQLTAMFSREMHKRKSSFTEKEFDLKLTYGNRILPNYYKKYIEDSNKIVALERRINTVYNGIPINGVLDKIEFVGNDAFVVDYKTGNSETAIKKIKGPDEIEKRKPQVFESQYGGDYWRQAIFYRILIDNYKEKKWNVLRTDFHFIEPNKKNEQVALEVLINTESIEIVKKQIEDTYRSIMNLEFDRGCGENYCEWCNFMKRNFSSLPMQTDDE